ncbi:hypothetical protein JW926_04990, partial [Candidatus Sumerlaeota bacterium]|nr:hypothetical protein [Candidatus Sumerlaeota bacterium]
MTRMYWKNPFFFSLLILFLFLPLVLLIRWNAYPPGGFFFTGFLQSDQITYTALFRSVILRGNGFSYSYPFAEQGSENPPVYFQIPFTLLAWIWKISGGNIVMTWEFFRLISSLAFFLILSSFLFHLMKRFYPDEAESPGFRWFFYALLAILFFGGGVAWLFSLLKFGFARDKGISLPDAFKSVESPYHWWFLNLFRNNLYPLELFHHACFFLALLGALRKKPLLIFTGLVLGCLSGVFVGIEISAVLMVFFLVETILKREKENLYHLGGALFVFLAFAAYYALFLPRFPVPRTLIQQHKKVFFELIPLHKYLPAYGILLFTTPFLFLKRDFRKMILKNREGRLLVCWAGAVGLLMFNDKFLPGSGLQPPHFSRGYFFSAMALLSGVGLFPLFQKAFLRNRLKAAPLLILATLLFLPDNVLFTIERFTDSPHVDILSLPPETKEALEFLDAITEPRVAFCPDRKFGHLVPAFSNHASIFSEYGLTANDEAKVKEAHRFFSGRDRKSFIEKYRITLIILPHQGG